MQVPVLDKQRTGETLLWLKHHESPPQKAGQRGTATPTNKNRSQFSVAQRGFMFQVYPTAPSSIPSAEIHIPCRVGRIDTHQGIHCSNKSHRQDHLKADEQCQFHAIDFFGKSAEFHDFHGWIPMSSSFQGSVNPAKHSPGILSCWWRAISQAIEPSTRMHRRHSAFRINSETKKPASSGQLASCSSRTDCNKNAMIVEQGVEHGINC